jgi:hypothetical protein
MIDLDKFIADGEREIEHLRFYKHDTVLVDRRGLVKFNRDAVKLAKQLKGLCELYNRALKGDTWYIPRKPVDRIMGRIK